VITALLALDPAPLDVARAPDRRVIGTCRHFALLSCALLRHRGVAARVRCGFATYFQPGHGLDHWITEYWHEKDGRWVRIDSEILGRDFLAEPEDLRPGQFLSGGEAWTAFREGRIDAWGRMEASYKGQTGADYDELIDTIARVCAGDDPAAIAGLYALDELRVPPELIT
jgi:hypothetical protein